jgi:hypothetical protein
MGEATIRKQPIKTDAAGQVALRQSVRYWWPGTNTAAPLSLRVCCGNTWQY